MPEDTMLEDLIQRALEAELTAKLAVSEEVRAHQLEVARRLRERADRYRAVLTQ